MLMGQPVSFSPLDPKGNEWGQLAAPNKPINLASELIQQAFGLRRQPSLNTALFCFSGTNARGIWVKTPRSRSVSGMLTWALNPVCQPEPLKKEKSRFTI